MKIAHLSVGDPFTAMWVNSQAKLGHEVHLITLQPPTEELQGVQTHILPFRRPLGYYLNIYHFRKLLKKIKPDLLHVHYATGHGTLGRLSGFHPSVLSVWGSDIMVTPYESRRMKKVVQKNLHYYDWICSTSKVLTDSTYKLCPDIPHLSITPIGVDTTRFIKNAPLKNDDESITIGTVKTMHPFYGIDILIKAFAEARKKLLGETSGIGQKMKLLIVGGGPIKAELEALAMDLDLNSVVEFIGQVPHARVQDYMNKMDVFVAMSRQESFGVAVIEASACELPVVVSNTGGLPEVVQDNVTGFIVENESVSQCAEALIKLVSNKDLRIHMGQAGRQFVLENFDWNHCLGVMTDVYQKTIDLVSRK